MQNAQVIATLLVVLAGGSGPAWAARVPFTGALTIQIGSAPPLTIPGSGVATVNTVGEPLPIQTLVVPAGAFATSVSVPVPNALPLVQLGLAGPGGTGSLKNGRIVAGGLRPQAVGASTVCSRRHPLVSCGGRAQLSGAGGLSGSILLGISGRPGSPLWSVAVPLEVLGGRSTTAAGDPYNVAVTLSGAGWTEGTAKVFNPGATTLTITGARNTATETIQNASLTLVSPLQIQVQRAGGTTFLPSFAKLELHFAPEPGASLLVLAAAATLLGLVGWRRMVR